MHMSLKCIVSLYVIKYIIVNDCFVICVGSSLLSKTVDVTVVKPASIDMIRGIIGDPNTIYKCHSVDQSYYVYYFCKNHLLDVAENKKQPILFMEDRSTDELDGLMVATFKPRMYNNRDHLVLWGCIQVSLNTHPKVAISRAFDITGVYHFYKYLSAVKTFSESYKKHIVLVHV